MFKLSKKLIFSLTTLTLLAFKSSDLKKDTDSYSTIAKSGDLIFQTEIGRPQALAIQVATFSPYNHVGVVVEENKKLFVYEAHGPVKKIPLEKYVDRWGTGSRFVVYRHQDTDKKSQSKVITYLKRQSGKPYDNRLSWDDSSMYCSELAYKALDFANLSMEKPQKMKEMKSSLLIGKIIPNNYRLSDVNMEDYVVAPSHLSRDKNLSKVYQNW